MRETGFRGKWAPGGRVKRRGVVVLLLLGLVFTLMGAVPLIQALPVLLYAKRALATVETVEQLAEAKRYRVRVAFETMEGAAGPATGSGG
ncbi:MAG: hypothetical protein NTV52_25595 [Acidobacteria bacterium]|nr:hypothetical protein [Acidobacteriota bacterium]